MHNLSNSNRLELAITVGCLLLIVAFPPVGVLLAFLTVLGYLLVGKSRKKKLRSIGFRSPGNWGSTILLCVLLAVVIEFSFQIFFTPLIEQFTRSETDLTAYDGIRGNLPGYLLMLLVGWVVGGFIEEILFRGFLITRLSRLFRDERTGNYVAIIVTSAAFGFSHLYQGWSGVISTGLIAVLFGLIFIKYHKILWYTILTHGLVNVTSLTLIFLSLDKELNTLIFL